MKKTLQFGFLALSILFSIKSARSQTISNDFFGVNAWMPDTIGNYFACPEPPCYFNGKLHKNWPKVKASGSTIVRFGGISADRNMPTNFQYIRMIDSIRANGMEPMIQVPFFNNRYTAQQAAAIVHYINVVKGKNVKYWIIGNEPNLSYSYTTAAQVASYFKPFASAMKNADPSILIIGPETAWYDQAIINGLTTPGGASDITGKDGAGRYYLDILSFHTYPFNGTQTRAQVISKLTSAGSLKDNLIALNARLATANSYHGRTGAAALKTAITEANVDYKNSSTDNLNGVGANSFVGGQFVAEMMGVGMKNGVDFFNLWSVIEGSSTALNIGFLDNSTGNKKPLYYHFKLLADNFKGNYVNGTTNQVNVKSFASEDGQQVAVMILNEDLTNNFTYTVRLNTTAIAGTSALKINANAGLAKEFTDVIQNQSTTLLLFDANGNIIKKSEYKLLGNANLNLPPTVTVLSSSQTATITPSGPISFCAGGSVLLNANTGTGYTYQWKKDNIAISGATNASYTATASGSYSVAITVAGVTNTSSAIAITVSPLPVATLIPAGPTSFATGGSVVLNASTGTGYTYQWKKDNVVIVGATAASYTASTAGSYHVVINQGICSAVSSAVVTTIVSNSAVISPAGPTTFCAGGSVTLNTNATPGNTYQWKKDNVVISGANGSSYLATASGSYTVAITASGITNTSAAVIITVSPMPSATITPAGPISFAAGSSVTLNAPAGTGYLYQWKKDGVNISGATNLSYVATLAGSYQIKITQGTCIDWSSPVSITILPTAIITPAGPTNFCDGGSVILNANVGTGNTYQWKKDNIAISGATSSSYTATESGSYSVSITIAGLSNTSLAITITESPIPAAIITPVGSTSFITGGNVVLNASTGTGYIYQWKKDNMAISGATNASYTASVAGSYQVQIDKGLCNALSEAVVITILPAATITAAGLTTFCTGGSVTLNANTGAGNTYQWKKDNIAIIGAINLSYTATATGNYSVVITNGGLISTSAPIAISVMPLPLATITPLGATTMCSGSVGLQANTGAGLIYQWLRDNNPIAGATNALYSASSSGSYQVKITQGSCIAVSVPTIVKVQSSLFASITPGGPTTFCSGGKVVLYASTCSGYQYQWIKNGVNIAGAKSSSYIASVSGKYQVRIAKNGVKDWSAPLNVNINDCKGLLTKESIDPTLDSADDSSIISSVADHEIVEGNNFEINVFPNPTNGNYIIELGAENSEESDFEIIVTNTIGQTIYHKYSIFSGKKQEIGFSENDPGGIYIVNVKTKNKIATKKIIFNK
ncbi:MAG: T9SS type A sorting domain-containing protein [Bacteroidota bacterium]